MSYSLAFTQSLYMTIYIASKVERKIYDFTPTQQISQDLNIPPSSAGVILRALSRAGIIETREGANGGVRLAVPPEQVTLLDLFMAVERGRPLFQVNMQLWVTGEKPTRVQNAVRQALFEAEGVLKQQLQSVTIRQLIDASRAADAQ